MTADQTIISQYEEIDRVHKEFSGSLKDFSRELSRELDNIYKIMDTLRQNWKGSMSENFQSNFKKKTDKLEECDQRINDLSHQLDELSRKLQEGLEFLRTH